VDVDVVGVTMFRDGTGAVHIEERPANNVQGPTMGVHASAPWAQDALFGLQVNRAPFPRVAVLRVVKESLALERFARLGEFTAEPKRRGMEAAMSDAEHSPGRLATCAECGVTSQPAQRYHRENCTNAVATRARMCAEELLAALEAAVSMGESHAVAAHSLHGAVSTVGTCARASCAAALAVYGRARGLVDRVRGKR